MELSDYSLSSIIKKDKQVINDFIINKDLSSALRVSELISKYANKPLYCSKTFQLILYDYGFEFNAPIRHYYNDFNGFFKLLFIYTISAARLDSKRNGWVTRNELKSLFNNELVSYAGFNNSINDWVGRINETNYLEVNSRKNVRLIGRIKVYNHHFFPL